MDQLLTEAQRLLRHVFNWLPLDWLPWIVLAILVLVFVLILRSFLRQRGSRSGAMRPGRLGSSGDLGIDVLALGERGPPPYATVLEFHGVRVRLAALILAPAGRATRLPPFHQIPGVFEAIVPGLENVVSTHQPFISRWPGQLSPRGFAHTFFSQVRLPGEGGKGTPWCSVAGLFKLEGQPMMVGMVFRATLPNSIGQTIVEREEEWLSILQTKAPE